MGPTSSPVSFAICPPSLSIHCPSATRLAPLHRKSYGRSSITIRSCHQPAPWPNLSPVLFRARQLPDMFGDKLWPNPPLWRFLLLSDGQTVLHLRILLKAVRMRLLEVAPTSLDDLMRNSTPGRSGNVVGATAALDHGEVEAGASESASLVASLLSGIQNPLTRRQIHLVDNAGRILIHATSWWDASVYAEIMGPNQYLSVWEALSRRCVHVSRRFHGLHYGQCPQLDHVFEHPGPFWAKYYVFKTNRRPMIVVCEVYSPELERYLGVMPRPRIPSGGVGLALGENRVSTVAPELSEEPFSSNGKTVRRNSGGSADHESISPKAAVDGFESEGL